ncbi:FLZ-type domain-containing protein [Psidium guajava]|nr:FLZ-type domain-containing protein [Psidium guajava]
MAIVEIIVGSVLGSVLQVLFEKLASLGLEYAQRKAAPPSSGYNIGLLKKWEKMLLTIYAVLDDAEDKRLISKGPVKLWLDDVRDLAYDMEDLLDEFAIQAAEDKSVAKSCTSRDWVNWKLFSFGRDKSSSSNPNPCLLVFETKVQKINDRLKDIVERIEYLSLIENAVNRSSNIEKRLPSTSLQATQFFGRDTEEAEIVELLTGEAQNGNTKLCIVPIIGMGGVGKTALAQRLYNDAKVKRCFEKRAWICVSDTFDVLDITKTILQSVTQSSCEGKDLNELQVKLKDSLSEKKFLVVLDDVWNENYEKWTTLLLPLEAGAKGSKIMVTTRNLTVISLTRFPPYHLKGLPLDNCTSLLAFHSLGASNFEGHPYLETVGKKIAEKCKGLPLAAKMLGGALSSEKNPDKWEAILNNRKWETGEKDDVLSVLKLSYVHLPSYLKRCFAYCAVYPKGYEIERDELVLLWIAEGFLDGQRENEKNLRLGRDYFDELVSRSFLEQSRVDASKFSMHDLLNDLANSIAEKTCLSSWESQLAVNEDVASLEKARYASFISSHFVTSKCLRAYHSMKALRSLILVRVGSRWKSLSISNEVLEDLLTKLEYLRVLSLCHCGIAKVPHSVGQLKHLRYLNFSHTYIDRLPESIVDLRKLQTLILRGCPNLSTLPLGITKMVSLQFLDIRDTESLKEMPLGMGNLKNLIVLSKFVVGPEKGSRLKELKNLPHLQGELFISELQKVKEARDVIEANLFGKKGLNNLFLNWSEDFKNIRDDKHESRVLDYLRPYTDMESLTISHYGGAKFPSWLHGSSYSKLVSLRLRDCPSVTSLPPLGQLPSLNELSIKGLPTIRMIGPEFYGGKRPFLSLTTLEFEEMLAWRDWSCNARGQEDEAPFSSLQHLVARSCPSLVGPLPCPLDHLIKLEIHSCPHLHESIGEIRLPSLHELYLEDCSKEILKSLVHLRSLTILKIKKLAELVCFDHGFLSCLVELKELHLVVCDKLTHLWQDGNEMLDLTRLQRVAIICCSRFKSFVAGGGAIELPCNLERMELIYCTSLEKLPSKMRTLGHLIIEGCPKLTRLTFPPDDLGSNKPVSQLEPLEIGERDSLASFPFAKGGGVARKTLYIKYCETLGSLTQCIPTLSHLTELCVWNCPALEVEDFPPLPITLSRLQLWSCPKIKSIISCNIASCKNLTELSIADCPALETEDFPPLPISLSRLVLRDCPKITCLPNRWHQLTSLQELQIYSCQNIKCLPDGGFPPNLRSLEIWNCMNVKQPLREWDLPMLTSLRSLTIDGRMGGEGEKVCFPSEDEDAWSRLFPSSLTNLSVRFMSEVERLSSGLCNHLSSLQYLSIAHCPKLRDLPEGGLPPSLQQLRISGCEILQDRCSKPAGHYWPLIREIPEIYIHLPDPMN